MAESNGSGALIFATGTLFGAFLVYLILKKEPATTAQAMTPDLSAEVQYLYAELQRLRRENDELRLRLQIAAPQGPIMTAAPQTPAPAPAPAVTAKPSPAPVIAPVVVKEKAVTIHNEENWDFKKDNKGKITGLAINRRVTSG